MASIIVNPVDDPFLRQMQLTLEAQTREMLKGPLMKIAEQEIDKVVEAAVDSLRPKVEAYLMEYDRSAVINLIIQRPKED